MTNSIQRQLQIPQSREQVWQAITDSAVLAEWMYPNDFEPRVGHRFTFRVPANPKLNFDGLTVRCEVLECEPPSDRSHGQLAFSWSAGGPVENTRVSFRLEPDGDGTRLYFEHSGFDLSLQFGEQAFQGAEYGWAKMLKQFATVVARDRSALTAERVLSACPQQVFAAFAQPDLLAQWWGPNDFTNTFEQFEFRPGGRWIFVMHGPNGAHYPNENVFREIVLNFKIVIEHVVNPWFQLTVALSPRGDHTHLTWVQKFASPEMAAKISALIGNSNEQNLDRLEALLARENA